MVHILSVKLNKSFSFNFLRGLLGEVLCVSLLFMFSNTSYAATSTLNVGDSKSYVLTYPVTSYNSYLDDYGNMYSSVTVTGNINVGNGFSSYVPCTVSLILNTSQGDFPIYYNDSTLTSSTAGRTLTVSGVPTGLTLYVTQYNTGSSPVSVSTPSFSPSVSATVYSLDTNDVDYTSQLNTIITNQNTSNGYLSGIQTYLNLINNHINLIMQDTGAIKSTCDAIFVDVHNISNGVYEINSNVDSIVSIIRGDLGNGYDLVSFNTDFFSFGGGTSFPCNFYDKFLYTDNVNIFNSPSLSTPYFYFVNNYIGGNTNSVPIVNSPSGTYSFYQFFVTTQPMSISNSFVSLFYGTDGVNNSNTYHSSVFKQQNGLYYNVFCIDFDAYSNFDSFTSFLNFDSNFNTYGVKYAYFALARKNGTISDLMDLMEKQWQGSYNVPTETTTAITNLDGSLGSVEATEQSYYESYDTAYNNTGIADWNLSVLATEFSFVQATVNLFYNGLPSTIRFLIVSVLVIGIFGIILSTLGRIRK